MLCMIRVHRPHVRIVDPSFHDEIVVIPKDNIAAIIMDAEAAKEYFGS